MWSTLFYVVVNNLTIYKIYIYIYIYVCVCVRGERKREREREREREGGGRGKEHEDDLTQSTLHTVYNLRILLFL